MRNTREPLSLDERKQLRLSLYCTVAYLLVFAGYFLIMWLDEVLHYATLFGVDEHHVWVFLSELMAIPVFLAFLAGWGLSIAYAAAVIPRRPICLIWIVGPPVVLFMGLPLLIVIHFLTR